MLLLNFSHPLTRPQLAEIESLLKAAIEEVHDYPSQFDSHAPFHSQVVELVDAIELSSSQWQTTPLVVNPPSFSPIAAVLLAELHGRMGNFPPIVRLTPAKGSTFPSFVVAEIINLNLIRHQARGRRNSSSGTTHAGF